MLTGLAFCPHPPALHPAVGCGEPLRDVLADADAAVRRLLATGPDLVVVLGAGPVSAAFGHGDRGSLQGWGASVHVALGPPGCAGRSDLPLSLTIGAWLLQRAGAAAPAQGFAVAPDAARDRLDDWAGELRALPGRVGLLVMGDGSARRSAAAPGAFDTRAQAYDDGVAQSLATGDPLPLAGLDADLGAALLAAGVPAWRLAGRAASGAAWDADLLRADAPLGVGYLVATWVRRPAAGTVADTAADPAADHGP